MNIRKFLPAVLLGAALAASGTVALAKEHGGGDRGGQHEGENGGPGNARLVQR